MKAVAFVGPGRLEVREVPDPVPGPGEVVLAVAYCGICGSDLHEYASQGPSLRAAGAFQPIMGHELTGRVVSRGAAVKGLREGDPVVVHPGRPCHECYYCRAGLSNLCTEGTGSGYQQPGGYAEYVRIRADQAVPLPDPSWLEPAALSEPLGVALHALNRGALRPSETVFVAGGGPIGLLTLLAARYRGAGKVVVSEPAASRRELARALGADAVIDPAEGAPARVRDLTAGLGADLAVESVGIGPAMDDCMASVRRGGRVVVAGVFEDRYPLDLLRMLIQEHTVIGTFGYQAELRDAANLIVSRSLDVGSLISRLVTLDQVPDVFAELAADRNVSQKVLVRPGSGTRSV